MALRLVGSGNSCAGRVEMFYDGHWGRVCDDYWDLPDAQVVCRQLGCGNAISPSGRSDFGLGRGLIIVNGVQCIGDEEFLWNCLHRQYNVPSYGHHKDAFVTCSGSIKPTGK
ncbi:scavenger receptor cysteine-rich domain-containing group B protein-like [Hyperolius riggenbachi]|uniref:scavenger receptor cysteine-rich domain-containing group B protein-like n=1 Tax=Hyperolius riggenbachi TaxID=752182 RepID=UPI0035A283B2